MTDTAALAAPPSPAAAKQPIAPAPVPGNAIITPASVASPIITINSSAAKGQLTAAVTGLVRVLGSILIARGAMTPAQANTIEPIIEQLVIGTAMVVAGQAWAQLRDWLSHQKTWAAALADPANVVVK